MAKYKKKPLIVDAVQLTEHTTVETLEGVMQASAGDWLITGVKGEKYICRDDIFRATYEPVGTQGFRPIGRSPS